MRITIITLYRGESADTYVTAVKGEVTEEQEKKIAKDLCLKTEDDEALDQVGFQQIELLDSPNEVHNLLNAFPDACTYDGTSDLD